MYGENSAFVWLSRKKRFWYFKVYFYGGPHSTFYFVVCVCSKRADNYFFYFVDHFDVFYFVRKTAWRNHVILQSSPEVDCLWAYTYRSKKHKTCAIAIVFNVPCSKCEVLWMNSVTIYPYCRIWASRSESRFRMYGCSATIILWLESFRTGHSRTVETKLNIIESLEILSGLNKYCDDFGPKYKSHLWQLSCMASLRCFHA